MTPPSLDEVRRALAQARALGFLGPGDIDDHLEHSLAFADVVGAAPTSLLDLGSGGGLPGLVLAASWPGTGVVLMDTNRRRTSFLANAAAALGFGPRVAVVRARAEVGAHDPRWRGRFEVVTARSFAAPALTAECGGAFLAIGGRLVASEPPDERGRWPDAPLAELGLVGAAAAARGRHFVVLTRTREPAPGTPRSWRDMERRPAF